MAVKETAESTKAKLIDKHYELSMSLALQSVRIIEMQKQLIKMSDELLAVEAQLDLIDAKEKGKIN